MYRRFKVQTLLVEICYIFFSLILVSNPTSENERNKDANDSYKSHSQGIGRTSVVGSRLSPKCGWLGLWALS